MRAIAAGERQAFAQFSHRYLRRSLALAKRVCGHDADAEEVVQDAFLQVWRHAGSWREQSRPTTWLYRIIMNGCLSRRRRQQPEFAPLDTVDSLQDPSDDAVAQLEGQQLASAIATAMAELPDRQKAALGLCYYDDLSCAEAAQVMQVSVSAMEGLLVRARRMMRKKLAPLLPPDRSEKAAPRKREES